MSSAAPSRLIQLVLVPALFYAGVKLSLMLAVMPDVMVMLWLPNSVLLAALIHYGFRRYVHFAVLIIVAEIAADFPTFTVFEAVLFGAVNLIEVTVAYLLLRSWRFDPGFAAPSDIVKFLAAGPVIGALVAGCLAAGIYTHMRGADKAYLELLRVWWFSDGTGLLIVTPFVLSVWPLSRHGAAEHDKLRWFDGIAAVLALVVVSIFVMSEQGMFRGMQVRPILLFPFVVYAAARFTPRATTVVLVAFAAVVLIATKNGQQPFGDLPTGETVLQAQLLVFLMAVTSSGLAALLFQLRTTARELEARVEERTAELRSANAELRRLTIADSLTDLLNRRALFESIRREMARELRHPHELAVIMFDLDNFKAVNDNYGHAAGDIVLRHVAALAAHTVRSTDILARYGGEEFVIVAPETTKRQALQLAERLRATLQATDMAVNDNRLRVTASFGVSMLRADDREPEQILDRADTALYAAKANGRNQVVMERAGGEHSKGIDPCPTRDAARREDAARQA